MGKLATYTRRTVLAATAVVGGGFAVGYYLYKRDPGNPLLDDLPPGSEALNPYVRIDRDGVTLITPRADVGQGVQTVLAAMLAEELDIAWDDIRIEHGPPSLAYYNTRVMAEGLPFASTDQRWIARRARVFGDMLGKWLGGHVTGGSTSVPDGFDKMREAGAVARQMLLGAAAELSGAPHQQLRTADGAVVLPDGERLAYTELAARAATIEPPSTVTLKPAAKWRYLGRPMQRLDVVAKSTGQAEFGIDVALDGLRYASVRTAPGLGAPCLSFDAGDIESRRGIEAVVPITGGIAVIADNTWRAIMAARDVRCTWGEAPYPPDTEAMAAELAASFTRERRDNRLRDDGDVEAAIDADAPYVEYRVPHLAHAPLEPMNATVRLTDDRLDLWTGTQIPLQLVKTARQLTGLEAEQIHVHTLPSGGSFGRRLEDDFVRQAIETAMASPGGPIKMTWSREQDMTHDFCRPLAIARGRGRVDAGRLAAFELDVASTSVVASQAGRLDLNVPGPDVAIVAGAWDQPYAIEHYRVTGYRAPEMAPVSSWRSVGASINGFFHDCLLDELLTGAGIDPLEGRLALMVDAPSRAVLEAVGEMSDWARPRPDGRALGVGFCLSFGVPCATVVEVSDQQGRLRLEHAWVAADIGLTLDPVNVDAQLSGGALFGLGHAMFGEITFASGAIEQDNYHTYRPLRLREAPPVTTRALQTQATIRGIGEPAVPPAAPALANAVFALTGERIRRLPLARSVRFVD